MGETFQKTVEDFICEKCDFRVRGSGYTNHCPRCLWSKHVDIFPGDRKAKCLGLMEPIAVELKEGKYVIVHRCLRCGITKKNRSEKKDNMSEIIALSANSLPTNRLE